MEAGNKKQEKSLVSRLFCMESLICLVGVACVIYGVADGFRIMQFFFGICIVVGSVLLHFVRKKDWDAHWAEMDKIRQAHEARMAEEREKKR